MPEYLVTNPSEPACRRSPRTPAPAAGPSAPRIAARLIGPSPSSRPLGHRRQEDRRAGRGDRHDVQDRRLPILRRRRLVAGDGLPLDDLIVQARAGGSSGTSAPPSGASPAGAPRPAPPPTAGRTASTPARPDAGGQRRPGRDDSAAPGGVVGCSASWGNRHSSRGFQTRSRITPGQQAGDGRDEVHQLEARRSSTRRTARRRTSRRRPASAGQTARVSPPADHRPDQPERDDQRQRRQDPPRHGAEGLDLSSPVISRQGADRHADRPPGDRRRVGDQAEQRRLERPEAQADQERRRDRHRCPESGRPLDERPEREGDQDRLDAAGPPKAARSTPSSRRTGRSGHGDVIKEDRRHDQPDDPEGREDQPAADAGQGQPGYGHAGRPRSTADQSGPSGGRRGRPARRPTRPEASRPSSTSTGKAATAVEAGQFPSGSYCWTHPWIDPTCPAPAPRPSVGLPG